MHAYCFSFFYKKNSHIGNVDEEHMLDLVLEWLLCNVNVNVNVNVRVPTCIARVCSE